MIETVLRTPGAGLRHLVDQDAFAVIRPLSAAALHGVEIDSNASNASACSYPLARVEYPRIKVGQTATRRRLVGRIWRTMEIVNAFNEIVIYQTEGEVYAPHLTCGVTSLLNVARTDAGEGRSTLHFTRP